MSGNDPKLSEMVQDVQEMARVDQEMFRNCQEMVRLWSKMVQSGQGGQGHISKVNENVHSLSHSLSHSVTLITSRASCDAQERKKY